MKWFAQMTIALFVVLAVSADFGMVGAAGAKDIKNVKRDLFDAFAEQIIAGINASRRSTALATKVDAAAEYNKKAYAYISGNKPRIALWPFQAHKIPISTKVAEEFNEQLLASLLQKSKGRHQFIARNALKTIISDMSETGALDEPGDDAIAALMKRARDVDILIEGRMRLEGKKIFLVYKAVQMDGAIVAQTKPAVIELKPQTIAARNDLLTLDQAVLAAAKKLSESINDITELRLGGIRYQTTGIQPEFGRFLQERMAAGLEEAYSNVLSQRRIKVRNLKIGKNVRGIAVQARKLKDAHATDSATSYLFTGSYWLLGDIIELRFNLKNKENLSTSWIGRIRKSVVAGLQLKPKSDFEDLRENDGLGPFRFQLTSGRGKDPTYKIGDNLDLLMRLEEDSWAYCFYHQADGKVIQILPNPPFWQMLAQPLFAKHKAHVMPGKTTFPFDLTFVPPVGRELVKCFAVSRNVTKELPPALQGRSLEPLPKNMVKGLSRRFRQLPHAGVVEASLVITVTK